MVRSETAAQDAIPTRQAVVEALRRVLADIEAGRLRGGGWREQYIASAIGLLASTRCPPKDFGYLWLSTMSNVRYRIPAVM